jgi:acyl-CoA synthetase (AMP-forming)/AMP-acid ligase II
MSRTFATILRELAARTPEAPALTCDDETWTFAAFDALSSQSAQALVAAGVRPGDRVGILSRNCAEFYELIFACSKAGAVVVGLNWRLSAQEIDAIVADAKPALIFTGDNGESSLLSEAAQPPPGFTRVIGLGAEFKAWRAAASARDPGHVGAPDDVAMILYTSGTTGLPKGAMLTNRGMSYTERLGGAWCMGPDSVNLVAMPLFHIGGCGYGASTFLVGGHTILMRDVNLPLIVKTMEKHRVTNAFFVPTVLQGLLDVPGIAAADLTSLKLLMYGASPIGEALLRRALDVLGCGFIQAYGMTETSGSVVTLDPAEHRLEGDGVGRLRSCGKALPFAEIRITNPDSFKESAVGAVGEIWIRSEMLMKGYWGKPEATAETMTADGWLRTGDAAYSDADGFIYLYDRFKDMIISGGENIYPAEIENALLFHPAVSEAAVIGVPHPRWGETPQAIIVTKPGESASADEVISFVRTRLARYKCPSSVIFAPSLPRNASGKLLKRELRRLYPPAG